MSISTVLVEKIKKDFMIGVYGTPKIPSDYEINQKLKDYLNDESPGATTSDSLDRLNYSGVASKLSNIVDDIGILYSSIEDQSRGILDQLTNSLKEQNLVKREIAQINSKVEDIESYDVRLDSMNYRYTESFNDTRNINNDLSDIVDISTGSFTIIPDNGKAIDLSHYNGRKLDITATDSFPGRVIKQGYIGDTDASSITTNDDPRSLFYSVTTDTPSEVVISLPLQLSRDGQKRPINSVSVAIDSSVTNGSLQLSYHNGVTWKSVPGIDTRTITGDRTVFTFDTVDATHIRVDFKLSNPDTLKREYSVIIHEILILQASSKTKAVLYSKPISLDAYSSDTPLIDTLKCSVDADIPDGSNLRVWVAEDSLVSGCFTDSNGNIVQNNSPITTLYSSSSGYMYLSDIIDKSFLSGLSPFYGYTYDWKEIKPRGSDSQQDVPNEIKLANLKTKEHIISNMYNIGNYYKFGDLNHSSSNYPISGYNYFLSGWVNIDNPYWTYLEPLVNSGYLVSGVAISEVAHEDIEDINGNINTEVLNNPLFSGQWLGYGNGYSCAYFSSIYNRTMHFGEASSFIDGWWRPYSSAVTPTGIDSSLADGDFLSEIYNLGKSDYHFNNNDFYKIYRFYNSNLVDDSSIRLYTYQESPQSSGIYPNNFVWTYNSKWKTKTGTLVNQTDPTNSSGDFWENYRIALPTLTSDQVYLDEPIHELRVTNTNIVMSKSDYRLIYNANIPSGIGFDQLDVNYPSLKPTDVSFDITYIYKERNNYVSTWTAYGIYKKIGSDTLIFINNNNVIGKIVVKDLDNETSTEYHDENGQIKVTIKSDVEVKHLMFILYCDSDISSGFAKDGYIPSTVKGNMFIPNELRLVNKLEPMRLVSLYSLIYNSSSGDVNKFALVSDNSNSKFIVVKKPSKRSFPGYVYNNNDRSYSLDVNTQNKNYGHYVRIGYVGLSGITYTTGSLGNTVLNHLGTTDVNWNNGSVLPKYPNTSGTVTHNLHSTYGFPINLEDRYINLSGRFYNGDYDPRPNTFSSRTVGESDWRTWCVQKDAEALADYDASGYFDIHKYPLNDPKRYVSNRGYLFYDSGENLPAYYSIIYKKAENDLSTTKRFVYKIELTSDEGTSKAPLIRSITFDINR